MDWILCGIAALFILSIVWSILEYKRDLRKDQEIYDEYLENQRKLKFNRRGGNNSMKDVRINRQAKNDS